ncbi:MAG: ABC transporter substrate-binding protein [Chloroflexota bacterium]
MTPRSIAALWFALLLGVALVGGGLVAAYGGAAPYLVKVSGPRGAVDCGTSVRLTTTVVGIENGQPVVEQYVRWKVDRGSSSDQLSSRQTITDRNGRTSVTLDLASTDGDRRITATAAGIPGRATIKVDCPNPTPRPTPRATTRPIVRATPRPTVRPTRKPRPTATPVASGAPERATLTVGYLESSIPGRAPLLLADAQGDWSSRGLAVTQSLATDPIPGLLDGSLDVAVVPLDAALRAIADGTPIRILAGYHDYVADIVAVAPGVTSPADLAGKPVILGDDARAAIRREALAAAGWDLSTVQVQETLPDGGFDTWAGALVDGSVAMAPIRNRHRLAVQQANDTLVLDRQVYGQDVLVTSDATLAAAPNALTAFLAGEIAALSRLPDAATDRELFIAGARAGIPEPNRTGWTADLEDFRPWDGSFGDPAVGNGLGELDAYARDLLGWVPLPVDHLALDLLGAAQAAAGVDAAPVLALPDAPEAVTLTIGTPSADLVVTAPLLLAGAEGAWVTAGLDGATLTVADGVAGVVDGSLDLAVVSAADAAAAIDAGQPVQVVAGYATAATEPSVLIAAAAADDPTITAALVAVLHGLADLNLPDALDRAVAASGQPVAEDVAAGWPTIVATFAPFDASNPDGSPAGGALAAARAAVGLDTGS